VFGSRFVASSLGQVRVPGEVEERNGWIDGVMPPGHPGLVKHYFEMLNRGLEDLLFDAPVPQNLDHGFTKQLGFRSRTGLRL
jgi:hypothetical protein